MHNKSLETVGFLELGLGGFFVVGNTEDGIETDGL